MLTADELLVNYANGIFPMAQTADDPVLRWYSPPLRGILPVGGVHCSRSLRRNLARGGWRADTRFDFGAIVAACADRAETWINAPLTRLYAQLHGSGHAHALAVLHDDKLAGGVFGVSLGTAFFGESMFSHRTDGSKMALIWLSRHLADTGFTLCDTQFLTPHLASMGGKEIPRDLYLLALKGSLTKVADFGGRPIRDAHDLIATIR